MKSLNKWLEENNKKIEELDKKGWNKVSYQCELSEGFIRDFQDKVYWYNISCYQKLSEAFIREFQDKVYWNLISQYQKLSEKFIIEFKDRINFDYIITCFYSKQLQSKFQASWRYKII